ncbi:MAG: glycosyltransferase [Deltaproteobacteria bacterium]|nr:glycosyltransferase [Deltaproteobacteria bacterium]
MRILQIVHGFPPEAWAGTELVTYHLAHALQARGHQLTVLTRTADPTAPEFSLQAERYDGLAVVRVVNNHTQTTTFRLSYDNPFYDDLFREFLTQRQPDVVHFQHLAHFSTRLLPLATAAGFPTVLSLHDFFFPCHRIHLIDADGRLCPGPEGGTRCYTCLQGMALPEDVRHRFAAMEQAMVAARWILTPSAFLHERIAEYFPVLKDKLRLVPLGVKPVAAPPRRRRQPRDPLRLLYSGLLFPPKGAHILLDALNGIPTDTVTASLYGETLPYWQPYVDQLHRQAQGFAVHFPGAYPHGQFGKILSAHDVLVMPMICEETFSLVAREALMAGLPVVAARRGALPAVVQHEVNGLLFAPEDAADLRRCLMRLLHEPGLYERLSSSATQYKTMDEYAVEMESVYTEVSATPSPQRLRQHEEAGGSLDDMPKANRDVSLAWRPAQTFTVSVLIPTKNGERYLSEVLAGVRQQQGDFRLREVIAVDSGSQDATLPILRKYGVTIVQIPPEEFGHGRTRNRLAAQAQGEVLVFLTQDATPANDHWLQHLLAPLYADENIVGVYSRQQPRAHCHPMEWRRIVEEELHGQVDSRIHSAEENAEDYERNRWRYRFFANSSSVIRRTVWEHLPFPEVPFAEDQAWADLVLQAGYKTAYAADSLVVHSHSYGPWVNFCRHFEHAVAMRQLFAHFSPLRLQDCIPEALTVAKRDLIFWRRRTNQSKARVLGRWMLSAVSWHVAANFGIWLGERASRLPEPVVRLLSLQEQVKRK